MKQDCSGCFFRHYLHYRFNGVVDKLNTIKGVELKNINLRLAHPQALVPFNPLKFMQDLYWFIQINNLANPTSLEQERPRDSSKWRRERRVRWLTSGIQ